MSINLLIFFQKKNFLKLTIVHIYKYLLNTKNNSRKRDYSSNNQKQILITVK